MTLALERPRALARGWVVPLAAVVAVSLRLPFLGHSPGPDEAGFLMVGGQWHTGGSSLYGNYWVDRPPLLVWIFQIAANLGGLTALRLIGCLAVTAIVAGCAVAARAIAGPRAGNWAAIAAAALCTTPLLGTLEVNGELLAAPFIVLSIIATLYALRADENRTARLLALCAGTSAMCSVLIKQNLVDAFVFGLIVAVCSWHRGDVDARRLYRVIASAIGGALLAIGVFALVTMLHGTSLSGVFDAMYPFRIDASRVQAAGGSQHSIARLAKMLKEVFASGLVLLLLCAVWGVASKRLRGPAGWGLVAMLLFGVASIALGGNFWAHYLVELIVPLAIAMGVLVARRQLFVRPAIIVVAVLAMTTSLIWAAAEKPSESSRIGHSIAASSQPGDTIVTAYGHSDIDQQSGLASPYENLWSLPIKTRDPDLANLDQVLSGPDAPTWLVVWNHIASWGLNSDQVRTAVALNYHVVDQTHGHTVLLHDGLSRPHLIIPAKDTP